MNTGILTDDSVDFTASVNPRRSARGAPSAGFRQERASTGPPLARLSGRLDLALLHPGRVRHVDPFGDPGIASERHRPNPTTRLRYSLRIQPRLRPSWTPSSSKPLPTSGHGSPRTTPRRTTSWWASTRWGREDGARTRNDASAESNRV